LTEARISKKFRNGVQCADCKAVSAGCNEGPKERQQ